MRKGVVEQHPFVLQMFDDEDFQDFYAKYCLICKELICKALRNKSRQRRTQIKYYDDLNILLNDANQYDNYMLQKLGLEPREGSTVALTMTINLVLTNGVEILQKGFDLELYGVHEFAMIFHYLRYLYQMLVFNRKPILIGMAGEEITRYGMLNLEDLSSSADKFK